MVKMRFSYFLNIARFILLIGHQRLLEFNSLINDKISKKVIRAFFAFAVRAYSPTHYSFCITRNAYQNDHLLLLVSPSVRPLIPCKSVRDYLKQRDFQLLFLWGLLHIARSVQTAIQPINKNANFLAKKIACGYSVDKYRHLFKT